MHAYVFWKTKLNSSSQIRISVTGYYLIIKIVLKNLILLQIRDLTYLLCVKHF